MKAISCALAGTMVLLQCLWVPAALAGPRAPDITWDKDTVISGDETYRGASILLRGNLTITGKLTFVGVDLSIETPANGTLGICVMRRGTFNVLSSSSIHSADPTLHFLFQVYSDSTLKMDGSELRDCGWDDFENWTVNQPCDRGLYMASSTSSVTNSTISDNCVGVLVDSGASPRICNNTITRNLGAGVAVLGGSSPLIDGNDIGGNLLNNIAWPAGGVVSDASSPEITNNTISGNVDALYGCTVGVQASSGGSPVVSNNTITGHCDPGGWGSGFGIISTCAAEISENIIFGNDNGLELLGGDSELSGNIVDGNENPTGGIGLYDNSGSTSKGDVFSNSTVGVLLGEGSRATFEKSVFQDCVDGVNADTFQDQFQNTFTDCTFAANTRDVALAAFWGMGGGGSATLVRPSYDPKKVVVSDPQSTLIVKWDLGVTVAFESDGRPAEGAGVSVFDAGGSEAVALETDAAGRTGTVLLVECKWSSTGKKMLSPYNVSASLGGRTNWSAGVELDSSMNVTVLLDDVPPRLSITSPPDGWLTNQTSCELRGACEAGAVLGLDGAVLEVGPDGAWSATVDLEREGANTFTVEAADRSLNRAKATLVVFRDTEVPVLRVDSPVENFLVNSTQIVVSGTCGDPNASLALNGANLSLDGEGGFSLTFPLAEGPNALELVCRDAAGNTAVLVRRGTRDTVAPGLFVAQPLDGHATNLSEVEASGTAEAGSTLTVNGRSVPLSGSSFLVTLELEEGLNTFAFSARDRAGNVNTTIRGVLRDSLPPDLVVIRPADGEGSNRTVVEVVGSTEPNASVRVNGASVLLSGPLFRLNLTLAKQGANTITVESTDALGNTAVAVVTVMVDTVPPVLELRGPADGLLTRELSVEVTGLTEPGARVTVSGRNATVNAKGEFSATVDLDREGENLIQVVSRDGLQNMATKNLTLCRDSVLDCVIHSPGDGARVKLRNITVSGRTEAGAEVRVLGAPVPVGADGSFSVSVPLAKGANVITVSMNDTAGNQLSLTLNVTRVSTPSESAGSLAWPLAAGAGIAAAALASGALACRRRRRSA